MNTKISYLNDEVLSTLSGGLIIQGSASVIVYNDHILVGDGDLYLLYDPTVGKLALVSVNQMAAEQAPNVYLNPPQGDNVLLIK